jgi:hypothetical protein
MGKLWKIAKIKKGNKKNFEPNPLTIAIAKKVAKKDIKKTLKTNNL